jgi:hypothetical protein
MSVEAGGSAVNIVAHVVVDGATAVALGKTLDYFFPRFEHRENAMLVALETAAQVAILTLLSQQIGTILGNKVDPTNGLAFVVPAYMASPTLLSNISTLATALGTLFKGPVPA